MNITTNNYEAYLIDYLDGNLSSEETEQLKQFVAAQGLNWDKLTEDLPHLEAPQMVYQNKSELRSLSPYKSRSLSLSKGRPNRTIIPLYIKIASAAAAAGLLLTVSLWPEKSLPKVDPIAELKPVTAHLTITEEPLRIVPRRAIPFTEGQETTIKTKKETKNEFIRTEVETIAVLSSVKTQEIASFDNTDFALATDIELLRYQLETEQVLARLALEPDYEEEMPTSWIGKGIYRMTEGRCGSIGSLINAGLHIAKKEVVKTTTDMAMMAYERADEHFQEAKEQRKEKDGE